MGEPTIIETGGGSNNGGFGGFGEGGGVFLILFVLILFGMCGNGFGNRGGGGNDGGLTSVLPLMMSGFGNGGGHGCAAAVADGFALNNLQTGIMGINNNVVAGFHGVDRGLCDIGRQISDCCCTTQGAIKDVRFDIANGLCGLNNTIQNVGRDLMENQNAGTRAILDYLHTKETADLRAENQALKFQASQTAQNQFITQVGSDIVNRLNPPAIPSYQVANPYTGYGYTNRGNCGGNCGNCNNCGNCGWC